MIRTLCLTAIFVSLSAPALACSGSASGDAAAAGGMTMNMVYAKGDTGCGGNFPTDPGARVSKPRKGTVDYKNPRFVYVARPGASGTDSFAITRTSRGQPVKTTVNITFN